MQFTRILRTFVMATGLLGALGVGSASAYLLDPAALGQTRAPLATSAVPELPALPSAPAVPAGLSDLPDLPALPLVGDPTGGVPAIPGQPAPVAHRSGASGSSNRSGVSLLGADLPAAPTAGRALPGVSMPVTPPSIAGITGPVTRGDTPGTVLPDLDATGSDLAGLPGLDGIAARRGA